MGSVLHTLLQDLLRTALGKICIALVIHSSIKSLTAIAMVLNYLTSPGARKTDANVLPMAADMATASSLYLGAKYFEI
jgi:hypothetical protein